MIIHRIAVIADTHNRLPDSVVREISPANEIWHLGDVMRPETLDPLKKLSAPLTLVRGNNDACMDWPESMLLDRWGMTFYLVHIPPRRMPDVDYLLHGHTHVPRDEMFGSTRILNPGTTGKPNKGAPPSYAWLEIEKNGTVHWRMVWI